MTDSDTSELPKPSLKKADEGGAGRGGRSPDGSTNRDTPHPPRRSVASVKSHAETGSGKKGHRLVGVRIPAAGMVYRLVTTLKEIKTGDAVLLQGKEEEESIGWVVFVVEGESGESFQDRLFTGGFEKIGRVLSESERHFLDSREELEQRARQVCREKIRELQLPMRLSRIQYLLGGGRMVVYFTAENRVDFRELVRVLGSLLKVRVEMRHIGVRDETKLLGGIGLCGHAFCCSAYLKRFHPVSVRMAKNQELSLNPEGISGTCGRLLCCLEYENATYQSLREGLPKLKQAVQTVDGREGVVNAVHPLMGTVDLQLTDGSRACVVRCDICGCGGGEGQATAPEEALLEGEGGLIQEEGVVAAVKESRRRPAESPAVAKGQAGASRAAAQKGEPSGGRTPQRESAKAPGRPRPDASSGVMVPKAASKASGPPPSSATPERAVAAVTPVVEGSPTARKRRRRRRPSASAATEKKETP